MFVCGTCTFLFHWDLGEERASICQLLNLSQEWNAKVSKTEENLRGRKERKENYRTKLENVLKSDREASIKSYGQVTKLPVLNL